MVAKRLALNRFAHRCDVSKTVPLVFILQGLSKSCIFRSCEARETNIDQLILFREKQVYLPRKEVIHPQLPLRMPCYDLVLVTDPTFVPKLFRAFGHYRLP